MTSVGSRRVKSKKNGGHSGRPILLGEKNEFLQHNTCARIPLTRLTVQLAAAISHYFSSTRADAVTGHGEQRAGQVLGGVVTLLVRTQKSRNTHSLSLSFDERTVAMPSAHHHHAAGSHSRLRSLEHPERGCWACRRWVHKMVRNDGTKPYK